MTYLSLLTPSTLPYLLLFLTLSYILIGSIVNYRKLSSFRGPPLAAFTRAYLVYQSLRKRFAICEFDSLEKYGSPVRLGPNLLITDDADVIRHMGAPRSGWRRSVWYTSLAFDPRKDSVFSTRDEKVHADLKSKMMAAYNGRDIDDIEPDIDARVLDLIELIKSTYDGKSLDIAKVAQLFTMDVLSTVAFGKCFGNMAANKDIYGYVDATNAMLAPLELMMNHRNFLLLLGNRFMAYLLAPKGSDAMGLGRVLGFARAVVAERFRDDDEKVVKRDMLGSFVDKGLDQLQCEVEGALQIIAGSDSTTTILRCTLFQLAGNPPAYARLREEIDGAVEKGDVSFPVVSYAEAQKLEYVDACIWEGIRMWPPLFGTKAKVAPQGGDTIKGVYYPEGTEIGVCDKALCRNKKVFGEDSHIFRPGRWVESDEETRGAYRHVVESIFGAGRYTCLGKHIAMVELHKVFVELFRNFDWVLTDPMRGIDAYAHGQHVQSNMFLTPYLRQR